MADNPVKDQSETQLVESLSEAKRELFNLRFQLASGQLENTARINVVRKQIARINTEIRSRQLAGANGATS